MPEEYTLDEGLERQHYERLPVLASSILAHEERSEMIRRVFANLGKAVKEALPDLKEGKELVRS